MIDERHEELASLYAFDLLEGTERARFEAELDRDAHLQSLVADLRNTASSLALTAPAVTPPAALKNRILASVSRATDTARPDNVIRPPASLWRILPWAAAACLAFMCAWLGQRYVSARSEVTALRQRQELAEINLKSTEQQLEAERILTQRRLQDSQQAMAALTQELGTARTQVAERDRQLAEATNQLGERDRLLATGRTQLEDVRTRLADRERQVAALTERIDAVAGASADIGQQLGDARQQIAQLTNELKTQGDLATLKITALSSLLKNSPQAQAIAVWDPKKQEGLLDVQKLPALAANEDYQIWVVDPQYPIPVDGGVFTVEPTSGAARLKFKADRPVGAINAFAITRERKGGVPKAEGPFVLLGK
jgi:anti-sigma-K factor RskA